MIMAIETETSDAKLLGLLRRTGPMTVAEMSRGFGVTSTAIRQRVHRMMGQGLLERHVLRHGRGRPSHRYFATEKAWKLVGNNHGDLAIALWETIREIEDPEVRQGLLTRITAALAAKYERYIHGVTLESRLESLRKLFAERGVELEVDRSGDKPCLKVKDCPYRELTESSPAICMIEKMLFSALLKEDVHLTQWRVRGDGGCRFETDALDDVFVGRTPGGAGVRGLEPNAQTDWKG
ncbi:MAG: helix-turn-helix transcriptional regulator [Pirellulales bacterium]